ncbi:hypothetical protein MNBD_GAMMA11-2819 [hydrothermal vent metagenome]|uniref:Uncharacterized protein n=1 Tax=hydrothermal vent metagenome TaxID=652676 RepID=A0A3B0XPI4_9ZZZZ
MKNFVILIGGPGLFKGCDKAHDQSWTNYIVPLQLAAKKNLYDKQTDEIVHWVLYEPPYKKRWIDDHVITKKERQEVDGYHLHSIRKVAADKILAKGAFNYIGRIKAIAKSNEIRYKGISKPDEFWKYLESLDDDSISRVWYSGHASGSELMLSLIHNSACQAAAFTKDTIKNTDIVKWGSIQKKFNKTSGKVSKFYGCYTEGFAKKWNEFFKVNAAGAKNKIDFGVVNRASNIVNVMERIEKADTSEGAPNWTEY